MAGVERGDGVAVVDADDAPVNVAAEVLPAVIEAANCARRYCPEAKRFYERKKAHTNIIVATKSSRTSSRGRCAPARLVRYQWYANRRSSG